MKISWFLRQLTSGKASATVTARSAGVRRPPKPMPPPPPAVVRTKRHLFLTGSPGCGKTTLIRKLQQKLQEQGHTCRGFYTEEVRQDGERVGFDVVTMDGRRAVLSRAGNSKGKPLVGKYAVDVQAFEALALPELEPQQQGVALWVVDEVGKMELKSRRFFPAVLKLLSQAPLVLGTLPLPRQGQPLVEVEAVRERADVEVILVRRDNRDQLAEELAARLAVRLRG